MLVHFVQMPKSFFYNISSDLCGHLRSLYKKSSVSDLIQNLFFISRLVVILLSKRFVAISDYVFELKSLILAQIER